MCLNTDDVFGEPEMKKQLSYYSFPTEIYFGPGVVKQLQSHLEGYKSPLVVTDQGVVNLHWFKELLASLPSTSVVYSDIVGNPLESQVSAGVTLAKKHKVDVVIAVGGGAATDVAKAIALMQHHPGSLFDYEDGKQGALVVDQPIARLIAIPTTAGTGSEVGRSTVISDDQTHAKKVIFSPKLLPSLVLADPELTIGLPDSITAATGMDALTHLLEAYLAKGQHPICDGIALEGIRLVKQGLLPAYLAAKEGVNLTSEHLRARADMLHASMMGAIAFQKGLGVVHSCAHALSAICDLHHGLANALMLPASLRFNKQALPERFATLSHLVEEPFEEWVGQLLSDVEIPNRLSLVGVKQQQLDSLAAAALEDGCHRCNVRPVSLSDFRRLFEESF